MKPHRPEFAQAFERPAMSLPHGILRGRQIGLARRALLRSAAASWPRLGSAASGADRVPHFRAWAALTRRVDCPAGCKSCKRAGCTMPIYAAAALAKIAGCFAFWAWFRLDTRCCGWCSAWSHWEPSAGFWPWAPVEQAGRALRGLRGRLHRGLARVALGCRGVPT
jgi:hypothetical protein